MAGRMCSAMIEAIKLVRDKGWSVPRAAAHAGVTTRGLYYALRRP